MLYSTPPCLSNFLQQSDLCLFLSGQTLQVGAGGGRGGELPYKMEGGGDARRTFQGLIEKAVLGVPLKISD